MLSKQIQDRGRGLERELALALTLPKDNAPASSPRALVGMSTAIYRARTLVTDVALPRAVWFAGRKVTVLLTVLLAWAAIPPFATGAHRIVTTTPPGNALDLEPRPDHTGFQVHVRPAQTQASGLGRPRPGARRATPLGDADQPRSHARQLGAAAAGFLALCRRAPRTASKPPCGLGPASGVPPAATAG